MPDLIARDEAIAREAWEAKASLGWDQMHNHVRWALRDAVRLGRERAPQVPSSPEHDEALIAEARRRHPGYSFSTKVALELLAMARSGWTPEPDPDEEAVRAILGAWIGRNSNKATTRLVGGGFDDDPDFQAAVAAYRQAKRGEG